MHLFSSSSPRQAGVRRPPEDGVRRGARRDRLHQLLGQGQPGRRRPRLHLDLQLQLGAQHAARQPIQDRRLHLPGELETETDSGSATLGLRVITVQICTMILAT